MRQQRRRSYKIASDVRPRNNFMQNVLKQICSRRVFDPLAGEAGAGTNLCKLTLDARVSIGHHTTAALAALPSTTLSTPETPKVRRETCAKIFPTPFFCRRFVVTTFPIPRTLPARYAGCPTLCYRQSRLPSLPVVPCLPRESDPAKSTPVSV